MNGLEQGIKFFEWDPPFAKWFPGGLIKASYLCVDRPLEKK